MIVGASFDTVEDQKTFATEQEFNYKLISDEDKSIGKAYLAERTPEMPMYDFGIPRRITYLIDPDGNIAKCYDLEDGDHDYGAHADQILADIQALSG